MKLSIIIPNNVVEDQDDVAQIDLDDAEAVIAQEPPAYVDVYMDASFESVK